MKHTTLVLALVTAVSLGSVCAARAHPLDPALLELRELTGGRIDVTWKVPLAASQSLEPALPSGCSPTSPVRSSTDARSVTWRWSIACEAEGIVGKAIALRGLDGLQSNALLRVELADGRLVQAVLRPDLPEFTIPARSRWLDVFAAYVMLGIEHIAFGFDHLLFVLGLVLLVRGRRELLQTITAFTLGHSVTLSLAVLGVVRFPPAAIEALIAASIVVVALELVRQGAMGASGQGEVALVRRPWLMAFAFGLLHGLGFAGALAQVGLPRGEIPLALLAFNVGIELGQLGFVLVVGVLRMAIPVRAAAVGRLLPAYGIGALAMLWLYERVAIVMHGPR